MGLNALKTNILYIKVTRVYCEEFITADEFKEVFENSDSS